MRALTTILLSVTLTTAPAWASGSDDPTPYTLTPTGITFPTPLAAHGHVNIRLTDGTTRGLHLDPNNGHPGARWIGQTFLPWTALDVTSGCIAWVQWSGTNEHYGEGGQPPVCVPSEEPSWIPTVPTSTEPSTPSPTTPTAPSPTTPTPTTGDDSPTTSSPSPSSTPTPSSTPSNSEPSPEATTTPPTPTEDPWTTPSPEAPTPSTQPTSEPSSEEPDGSTSDPSTSAPSERGTDAATPSPSASASAELPVTGPSGALLAFAAVLTLAGLAAFALGRRTR